MKLSHIKNSTFNLLGQLVPLAAGLVTMPIIIRGLGPERFSLLTLVWAALGYFTLFDLGFGRATTKLLAELLARSNREKIGSLYWSSMAALAALSFAGAALLGLGAPLIIAHLNGVPPEFTKEVRSSIYILIFAIPVMTLTANARGVMEAQGKFLAINVLQLVVGTGSYVAPLFLLASGPALLNVVIALTLLRAFSLAVHLYFNFKTLPEIKAFPQVNLTQVNELWHFGGWLTISNIVGPILFYFDRFVLGLLLPIKIVGYYTTPVEVVTKLWIIPSSLVRVLFPEFARDLQSSPNQARSLYWRSSKLLAIAMAVPCLILGVWAHFILLTWLGPDFAEKASRPLQILSAGVYINSLAWIPYTLLQSLGRTKLIAMIHTAEIPIYAVIFWFWVHGYGIEGAAWAWAARALLDLGAMFTFARRELNLNLKAKNGDVP